MGRHLGTLLVGIAFESCKEMTSPRTLRVAALVALAVTSVFWFWLAAGLLTVHWPNNGNGVMAVVIVTTGVVILAYGLLSTVVSIASRSAQSLAPLLLEGVSIASLFVIVVFVVFFLSHASGTCRSPSCL